MDYPQREVAPRQALHLAPNDNTVIAFGNWVFEQQYVVKEMAPPLGRVSVRLAHNLGLLESGYIPDQVLSESDEAALQQTAMEALETHRPILRTCLDELPQLSIRQDIFKRLGAMTLIGLVEQSVYVFGQRLPYLGETATKLPVDGRLDLNEVHPEIAVNLERAAKLLANHESYGAEAYMNGAVRGLATLQQAWDTYDRPASASDEVFEALMADSGLDAKRFSF